MGKFKAVARIFGGGRRRPPPPQPITPPPPPPPIIQPPAPKRKAKTPIRQKKGGVRGATEAKGPGTVGGTLLTGAGGGTAGIGDSRLSLGKSLLGA